MGSHAAVVGIGIVLLVGLAVTFIILMDQRDVWGRLTRPRRRA